MVVGCVESKTNTHAKSLSLKPEKMKKKMTLKEKYYHAAIRLDIRLYVFARNYFLKRVSKTKQHKHKIYRKWLAAEAQVMFYGAFLLPIILAPRDRKVVEIATNLFLLAVFGFFYVHRFKANARESKEYDEKWDRRDSKGVQDEQKMLCAFMLIRGLQMRLKFMSMHIIVWLSYDLLLMPIIFINAWDIPMLIAMNVYFFGFIFHYYLDTIYDLGETGEKSKAKEKKRMTELQTKMWDRLVGNLKPAPMPTN